MGDLLYDALMQGRNKQVAKEEYLTASGQKQPASFEVREKELNIQDVMNDTAVTLHLRITEPGYLEIEAFSPDGIIKIEKNIVTTDDFTEGRYEFRFLIAAKKLHGGKNFAEIVFRTALSEIRVPVTVVNRIKVRAEISPRSIPVRLVNDYINLRLNRMEPRQWADSVLTALAGTPGDSAESIFYILYKAQAYISLGDFDSAKNNIEFAAEQMPKLRERNYALYCYFLYMAGLYNKDDDSDGGAADNGGVQDNEGGAAGGNGGAEDNDGGAADDNGGAQETGEGGNGSGTNPSALSALEKVKIVFESHKCWQILWILFYLDESYSTDRKAKLAAAEDAFYDMGCTSPVMYFEAFEILCAHPEMITGAGDFMLHVLYFAVKHRCLTAAMADALAGIIAGMDEKTLRITDRKVALKILRYAYLRFPQDTTLKAMLRLLAAEGDISDRAHAFYGMGIKRGFRSDSLSRLFILSSDRNDMTPVPDCVADYAAEHTGEVYDYRSYIYANIIKNRHANPVLYSRYIDDIARYAETRINTGANDECLAVIYREIIETGRLTENMRRNLYDVLCIRKIVCENRRMKKVLVFHNELPVYQEGILKDGITFVRVYSSDAVIVFMDATGNIYENVEHKCIKLMESREYIDICMKDVPINRYMLMKDTLPLLKAYRDPADILEYFSSHKADGQFRRQYEQKLLQDVVRYFAKNSRGDEKVYDALLKFRKYRLAPETRGRLIEIMIEKGLYDEAFAEIKEYGTAGMSTTAVADFAHAMVQLKGDEGENETLLGLCEKSFGVNGFDAFIFGYLEKYYDGSMELLTELYRSCRAYSLPAERIEERILKKSAQTGEIPGIITTLFNDYYENGKDARLKTAYLEFLAGTYLYSRMEGEDAVNAFFFDIIGREMAKGTRFCDDAAIAYLLFMADADEPDGKQIAIIKARLEELVSRGKMLEEMKVFGKYFELPATLSNSIIVSLYVKDAASRPRISYDIRSGGRTIHGDEQMDEIFRDCFVEYFTLFYGETVTVTLEDGRSAVIGYESLNVVDDGSRFSKLNGIIRERSGDSALLAERAKDYYITDCLAGRLFG